MCVFTAAYSCLASQFKCPQSQRCIPRSQVCDGRVDCLHAEDEGNCSNNLSLPLMPKSHPNCTSGQCQQEEQCDLTRHFQCNNSQCISQKWACDEECDCRDCSDESQQMCGIPCGPTELSCDNNRCLDIKFRCDGGQPRTCLSLCNQINLK